MANPTRHATRELSRIVQLALLEGKRGLVAAGVPPREVQRSRIPRPAWPSEQGCIVTPPPPPRQARSKTCLFADASATCSVTAAAPRGFQVFRYTRGEERRSTSGRSLGVVPSGFIRTRSSILSTRFFLCSSASLGLMRVCVCVCMLYLSV